MIALFLFLLFQTGAVPKASISGTVIDGGAIYLSPLFHARVELELSSGSQMVVRTDADGRFTFPDIPPGKYRLSVTQD